MQETKEDTKITVLGKTFDTEEDRRNYFRDELRKKLPELKQMEGFPIGEDEDILNLSDAPYYTACPNPWLNDFIAEWEEEKKQLEKDGKRVADFKVDEPYAADISEGKNNPIYMAHSYHTKVPHPAIMRFILHYTQPGDVVFDGFAGTGMTGVAASLCETPDKEFKHVIEKADNKVRWGKRNAICSDLSPIATFIANNYNKKKFLPNDVNKLKEKVNELEKKFRYFYKTLHNDEKVGDINFIIWSDVFTCNSCENEITYFNQAVNENRTKILDEFKCNKCSSNLKKRNLERVRLTMIINDEIIKVAKTKPVLINYTYKGKRYEKIPDLEDLKIIEEIETKYNKLIFPYDKLPRGLNTDQPLKSHGLNRVNQFFTKRSLVILNDLIDTNDNDLKFLFTSSMWNSSKLYRWRTSGKGGIMNGVLYIASIHQENNIFNILNH